MLYVEVPSIVGLEMRQVPTYFNNGLDYLQSKIPVKLYYSTGFDAGGLLVWMSAEQLMEVIRNATTSSIAVQPPRVEFGVTWINHTQRVLHTA